MLSSVVMLPHGAEIIPAPGRPYNEGFRPLHEAMLSAGRAIAARGTDLVFMFTPHGYSLSEDYAVYMHERYQGLFYTLSESNVFGDLASRSLWLGDQKQAEALLTTLNATGIPADGLIHGSPTYPLALAWGETVPLHYLVSESGPRVVIIGLPRTRHTRLADMQADLAGLGRILYDMAQAYAGNVAIVSSADLSHTHADKSPYGYHASSKEFDAAVQEWAATPTRDELNRMLALQPTALACGMAGMCVLQAILDACRFASTGVTYAAPTYFGMAVAEWA